jgi:hypothetical protein
VRWFWHKREEEVPAGPSPELVELREETVRAEEKLKETRAMSREVVRVSSTLKRLRNDNHFSDKIADAFGRLNG